ncbi:unnamed protein product [Strongylus vulgaris]|uniref:Collagen triple helix repeat protein n=1 Tax=Strongylus vulgaris TaxID=40348 RepID=A0A3P7JQF2_STRVU|nr:unnamed protein product [Strongylus vulgaris]
MPGYQGAAGPDGPPGPMGPPGAAGKNATVSNLIFCADYKLRPKIQYCLCPARGDPDGPPRTLAVAKPVDPY